MKEKKMKNQLLPTFFSPREKKTFKYNIGDISGKPNNEPILITVVFLSSVFPIDVLL